MLTLEDIYGDMGLSDDAFDAIVDRSLNPRSSEMLYDKMGELGLAAHHQLLDVGCRDARHTCELVRRFGCAAIGVDPLPFHVQRAQTVIAAEGWAERVTVREGKLGALPLAPQTVDYIWCRDVLTHVFELQAGLMDCQRVLKPHGQMLIYMTVATEQLAAHEAAFLCDNLAMAPNSMSAEYVEAAIMAAGLRLVERARIASEWREWWEETGDRRTSKQLLRIARLLRDRDRICAAIGEKSYRAELANCYWGVYQLLGKLCPMLYVVER